MATTSIKFNELTETLLESLDERSRDVIRRRFGIRTGEVETLESIGKEYGITRERVRQIESQAKKTLSSLRESLQEAEVLFTDIFSDNGGLLADDHLVKVVQEIFHENISGSHLALYLEILPDYKHVTRDPHFNPHWRRGSALPEKAAAAVQAAQAILKKTGHPIAEPELFSQMYTVIRESNQTLPARHMYAYLHASTAVSKTPFGEWGLDDWAETRPRGVGDKAYAVLRRHNKPEHFTKITELINAAAFDHKRANPQTVHNELIKDKRFVLVGRGLYGLAEWGFIPGTVADVLESLLSKAPQPLTREELVAQVLAQRQVKKNTILLGLQNERRFVKTPENRYTLRQAKS